MPEQLQDMGVLVPHFLMMRDGRIIPVADRMWEKAGGNRDKMIDIVFEFITTNIYYITDREAFGSEEFMGSPFQIATLGYGDCGNSAQLMESLLFYKGVPSRMVFGYALGNSHRWVEAFYKGQWMAFDTTTGETFPTSEREKRGYDNLFNVTPFSFSLAKLPMVPPLFLP
jgi:transglutaminase-like putative cysteine protease